MHGFFYLIFVFMTICCWGVYGPVLHEGQERMGVGALARWKPFMAVGISYFVIAVLFPLLTLYTKGERGNWTLGGFIWSFLAGTIASIGALGIILAFNFGGQPVFVMPLVFGCAPVVNTVVTMLMTRTVKEASLAFRLGVVVVAIGAAGVMVFKPREVTLDHLEQEVAAAESVGGAAEPEQADGGNGTGASSSPEMNDSPAASPESEAGALSKLWLWLLMIGSIGMTALCWGSYGPVLHTGQSKMNGSRMRPYLCVGLAYFVVAVLVPIPMLANDPGELTFDGAVWSLLGGVAGALGALGIVYSFHFGGKPILVMPLVFGCAPLMNTLSTTVAKGLWDDISWLFLGSVLLVVCGAVTVLLTAPRGPLPKKPESAKRPESSRSVEPSSGPRTDVAPAAPPPDHPERPERPPDEQR